MPPVRSWGLFRPPPLLPGLPIVWTPRVIIGALDLELRSLGIDPRAGVLAPYARALDLTHDGGRWHTPCPACGWRTRRLFWIPDGFRGVCCDTSRRLRNPSASSHPTRHRRRDRQGTRRYLFHQAADTLLAARLGSRDTVIRLEHLAAKLAGFAPAVRTLRQAVQFATLAAVLTVSAPPGPSRKTEITPAGPLARALAGDRLELLCAAWSLPVYAARVRAELAAEGLTTIRCLE